MECLVTEASATAVRALPLDTGRENAVMAKERNRAARRVEYMVVVEW